MGDPGRWAQARSISDEAQRLAEKIAHPTTLAFAFAYTATSCELRREDPRCVLELTRRSIELSTAHHLPMWLGWSTMLWGWARTELAQTEQERNEGAVVLREGLERWRAAGMIAGWPYFLGLLAGVLLKQGRIHEGLKATEDGLAWAEKTGERSSEAELHRLQGELHWAAGSRKEALRSLERALAVAIHQGARTFELRAAVSLGRQLLDLGRTEDVRRLLEQHARGFEDSPLQADLAEARALWNELPPLGSGAPEHPHAP